MQYIVRNEENK